MYNTTRPPIHHRAYGRHVASLLKAISALPEGDERKEATEVLLSIIQQMKGFFDKASNPEQLREDLIRIAGTQDNPQAGASSQATVRPPLPMTYPMSSPKNRSYGRYLTAFLSVIGELTNPEEQTQALIKVASIICAYRRNFGDPSTMINYIERQIGKPLVADVDRVKEALAIGIEQQRKSSVGIPASHGHRKATPHKRLTSRSKYK